MPMTKDQIINEAMALDPSEREAIAEQLMLSVNEGGRRAIEAAWLVEAKRRDEAYARGEIKASPLEDVLQRLRRGNGR